VHRSSPRHASKCAQTFPFGPVSVASVAMRQCLVKLLHGSVHPLFSWVRLLMVSYDRDTDILHPRPTLCCSSPAQCLCVNPGTIRVREHGWSIPMHHHHYHREQQLSACGVVSCD
jgi:hypothetical protein